MTLFDVFFQSVGALLLPLFFILVIGITLKNKNARAAVSYDKGYTIGERVVLSVCVFCLGAMVIGVFMKRF